jgi:hypothetical protein
MIAVGITRDNILGSNDSMVDHRSASPSDCLLRLVTVASAWATMFRSNQDEVEEFWRKPFAEVSHNLIKETKSVSLF